MRTEGDALAEKDRERLGRQRQLEVLTRSRRMAGSGYTRWWLRLVVAGKIAADAKRCRGAKGRPEIPGGRRT